MTNLYLVRYSTGTQDKPGALGSGISHARSGIKVLSWRFLCAPGIVPSNVGFLYTSNPRQATTMHLGALYEYLFERWSVTTLFWPDLAPRQLWFPTFVQTTGPWSHWSGFRTRSAVGIPSADRESVTWQFLWVAPPPTVACEVTFKVIQLLGFPKQTQFIVHVTESAGAGGQEWQASSIVTSIPAPVQIGSPWDLATDVVTHLPVVKPQVEIQPAWYFVP